MRDWIIPEWPVPKNVRSLFTTRNGGVSKGPGNTFRSLNLGDHVHDDPIDVANNRKVLRQYLPNEPIWLRQVHGTFPVWVNDNLRESEGDAALSHTYGDVCAIMVADCLPVFLCDSAGTAVGIVHAGWRGLAAGIVENSVAEIRNYCGDHKLMAWLGPAIGPSHFEVGETVREAFVNHSSVSVSAFTPQPGFSGNKWLADLFLLVRQRLAAVDVTDVYGGGICTYSHPSRFYSYRRDGETGRMAALIWLEKP